MRCFTDCLTRYTVWSPVDRHEYLQLVPLIVKNTELLGVFTNGVCIAAAFNAKAVATVK